MATPASDGSVDFYEDQAKTSAKRRLSSSPSDDTSKKRKVGFSNQVEIYSSTFSATKGLPTELWQRVFSSLPPDDLCRCLRVNHAFHSYLTQADVSMSVKPLYRGVDHLQVMDSESVWVGSRKVFAPSLPRPLLPGITERELLSLLGRSVCQSCGAQPSERTMMASSVGPGQYGVRIIWPFAKRLCGSCFSNECITDIELLKSNDNRLIKGLPFAFRTKTNDYFPSPTVVPPGTAIMKVFSHDQIKKLRIEASQVEEYYGRGAAEEWVKGLFETAKAQAAEINRWIQWERSLPPGVSVSQVLKTILRHPTEPLLRVIFTSSTFGLTSVVGNTPASQNMAARNIQGQSMLHSQHFYPSQQGFYSTEHMMMEREREIEHRCLQEISPPIFHDLLVHMDAYNEIINSNIPFNLNMWIQLKPRLEAERDSAEQRKWQSEEKDRLVQYASFLKGQPQTVQVATPQPEKAEEERFIQFQDGVRPTLGKIVDKLIDERWCEHGMSTVCAGNCRTFAADIVVETRAGFLNTYKKEYPYADEDKLLSLDTMKWVVENKIVPRVPTKMNKALFRCSECEDTSKWYGFDSVVQHFAAKHTEEFTKGNIVVDWKNAYWPADPIFDTEPEYQQRPLGKDNWNLHASDTIYDELSVPSAAIGASTPPSLSSNKTVAPVSVKKRPGHPSAVVPDGDEVSVVQMLSGWWERCRMVPDEFMPLSVKIHLMLHQMQTMFQETRGRQVPTELIMGEFKNLARDIRQFDEDDSLACCICMSAMADIDIGIFDLPYTERIQQVENFTVLGLLDHFKHTHADDEIKYIVELPEEKDIKGIVLEPEITQEMRTAMGSAFPSIFGPDGVKVTAMELQVRKTQRDILAFKAKNKNRSGAEKRKAQKARRAMDPVMYASQDVADYDTPGYDEEDQSDSPPVVGEDEYDPTRPAFLTPSKLAEHRRLLLSQTSATAVEFGYDEVRAALLRASSHYKDPAEPSPVPKYPAARKPRQRQQENRRTSGRGGKKYDVDFYAEEIPDVIRAPSVESAPPAVHYQLPSGQPQPLAASEHHTMAMPLRYDEAPVVSPYEVRHQPTYQPEVPTYHQPYQAVEYGHPPPVRAPQEPLRFVDEYGREVFPEGLEPVTAPPTWMPYQGAERAWGEPGGQPRFVYDE